ncbi:MAG: NAD(P)-dependent oxidoreductase [candidate division NC10 bacterium]
MPRVAVTNTTFDLLPHVKQELLALYPEAKFNADTPVGKITEDWLIDFLKGYEVAVIAVERYTERVISNLPDLKAIACCSVGVDHIDPAALKKHNVRLGWIPGVNKRSVAELTISFMINLLRKVSTFNLGLRGGEWPKSRMGLHLQGRTVGIHGCGNVGKEVVLLLQPFGVTVLACDRVDYADFYREQGVTRVSPAELWERSEVLSIHLPKNSTTIGMYSAQVLDRLRPGCLLINTARGEIVEEAALAQRLRDGRIAAAAFDVYSQEPPRDPPLLDLLKMDLSHQGYDILTAANGKDTLQIALAEQIDLILLDVMMPYIDGYHVAYELTNKLGAKAPYIIIMTSRDTTREKGIALMSGAHEVLQKPFEMAKLHERLAIVLATAS